MEKITGVHWNEAQKKWHSRIEVEGKRHYLGSFESYQEAVKIRKEAEVEYSVKKIMRLDDLEGERFGSLVVIGDTGKRDKQRHKILICRHDDGTLQEVSKTLLLRGSATGKTIRDGILGEKYICLKNGKYIVKKYINGKQKHFGSFNTLPEAIARRDEILQLIEQGKL